MIQEKKLSGFDIFSYLIEVILMSLIITLAGIGYLFLNVRNGVSVIPTIIMMCLILPPIGWLLIRRVEGYHEKKLREKYKTK